MPKRKKEKSNEFERLSKKLKRLERKIISGRRRLSSSSTGSDEPLSRYHRETDTIAAAEENIAEPQPGCSYWDDWPPTPANINDAEYYYDPYMASAAAAPTPTGAASPPRGASPPPEALPALAGPEPQPGAGPEPQPGASPEPQPAASAQPDPAQAPPPPEGTPSPPEAADHDAVTVSRPALDPDLLAILGEDPSTVKEYGDDVQNDLAIRINHIAISGLSKDLRKEIIDRHLIPANCKNIKAPTLNPEIRASLIESQAKRDKGIENKQSLNACALSALCRAITLLLSSENANQDLFKLLMDTARILADIQHGDSILRRYFVLSTVKKDLKDELEKTRIDNTLFGANLTETLKSAKSINKSGTELRSAVTFTPRPTRMNNYRPLNPQAPPAGRRPPPPGGARPPWPQRPAPPPPTPAQRSSWRTSSRQQQSRYRR